MDRNRIADLHKELITFPLYRMNASEELSDMRSEIIIAFRLEQDAIAPLPLKATMIDLADLREALIDCVEAELEKLQT